MDFPVLQKSGPEFSPVHWGGGWADFTKLFYGRNSRSKFAAIFYSAEKFLGHCPAGC
jgi:hypothetical protein